MVTIGKPVLSNAHRDCLTARRQSLQEKGCPYYFYLDNTKIHMSVVEWCFEHLDPSNTVTWHGQQFWFKNQDDYMQFVMTWQ